MWKSSVFSLSFLVDYAKGFGGKYGVQQDRKDKSALGWEEVTKVEAHPSQIDMKKGFGGQFGVEADRQDKVNLFICCLKINE